jgi:cytidylate kinase
VSFAVAQRLNYLFVDTGAFYRAITLLTLQQQVDPLASERVVEVARTASLDMSPDLKDDGRQFTFLADGEDITPRLNHPDVEEYVSNIAANAGVRAAILDAQRKLAARGNVIMAGRDIGSVVLPNAELKLYIDASLDKRSHRRYKQRLDNNEPADLDAIREGLRKRDDIDSSRETAPLRRAEDAVYLDTSDLTLNEAIDVAYAIITSWEAKPPHST